MTSSSLTIEKDGAVRSTPGGLSGSVLAPMAVSLALVFLHVGSSASTSLLQRLLGASLGVLAVFSCWRYFKLRLFHRLPLHEFGYVQFYVFIGLATATGTLRRGPRVSHDGVTMALIACLVFVGASVVLVPVGRVFGKWLGRVAGSLLPPRLPEGTRRVLPFWIVLVAVANSSLSARLPDSIRYPVNILAASYGLLLYLSGTNERGLTSRQRATRVFVVASLIGVAGLTTGMLGSLVTPLFIALVIVLVKFERLALRWLLGGVLVFALLNPAKRAFREGQGWDRFDAERRDETVDNIVAGPEEAALAWWDALKSSWLEDSSREATGTETTIDRLNFLTTVARTIDFAGSKVAYDDGSRWPLAFYTFVPRAILPEKPVFTQVYNNRFTVLFGLQSRKQTRNTTKAFPVVSDGYWNFGWYGVIFVGLIVGFYWSTVAHLWRRDHWALGWISVALFVTSRITTPLYSMVLGGVPQTVAGVSIASWGLFIVARAFSRRRVLVRP